MSNGPRRFIYNANAVGVGVSTNALQKYWASNTLPFIGGEATVPAGPEDHGFFQFGSAETTLIGRQVRPNLFETSASVTVRGLNILKGVIRCDLAKVTVHTTYDRSGSPRQTTVLSPVHPFTGLVINGANYDDVELETGLAGEAAEDFNTFPSKIASRRPGQHHKHASGTFFTTLAKANSKLNSTPLDHGVVVAAVPGIIRIHLCEWSAEPDCRCLTLMRVILADPPGGEIVIGDPDDNGRDYP